MSPGSMVDRQKLVIALATVVIGLCGATTPARTEKAEFCVARAISNDGSSIAITSRSSAASIGTLRKIEGRYRPMIWSESSIKTLDITAVRNAEVTAVSEDGRTVVGTGRPSDDVQHVAIWIDGRYHDLHDANLATKSTGVSVSADGSSVVGYVFESGQFKPFVVKGGRLFGFDSPNNPVDISADGRTIVGYDLANGKRARAAVHVLNGGTYRLMDHAKVSIAKAVSDDGQSILVEYQEWNPSVEYGVKLFRGRTTVDLMPLSRTRPQNILISGDGKIVAIGTKEASAGPGVAVVRSKKQADDFLRKTFGTKFSISLYSIDDHWKKNRLSNILNAREIDLNGWELKSLTGISYDGSVLVGNGKFNGKRMPWRLDLHGSPNSAIVALCP